MKRKCAGIILSGGLGSRMNYQDKGMVLYKGKPLIEYQIETLKHQIDYLVISANRNLEEYSQFGFPVITDLPQYQNMGPLGGIYSVASQLPEEIDLIQTIPCDTPFLPHDLVEKLSEPILFKDMEVAMAASPSGEHPTAMLFQRRLLPAIKAQLDEGSNFRLRSFIKAHQYENVMFEDEQFINFNDPATLAHWNSL